MKFYQIVFSPTGGTEKAANAITKEWGDVLTIDLSNPNRDYAEAVLDCNSLVLIAMPSFGGLAPQVALDRLAAMKGNGAKCAIAAVYGNRAYEDTLVQMEDVAKSTGFQVIAAVSAVAEHSIIHKYAAGRPDTEDCRKLESYGRKVLEKALSGSLSVPEIPGNRPYKKAGAGMIPKAASLCISCGLCAEKCPVSAIPVNNLKISDKTRCISCMRCVSVCPVHARKVSEILMKSAAMAINKECSVRKEAELFI